MLMVAAYLPLEPIPLHAGHDAHIAYRAIAQRRECLSIAWAVVCRNGTLY